MLGRAKLPSGYQKTSKTSRLDLDLQFNFNQNRLKANPSSNEITDITSNNSQCRWFMIKEQPSLSFRIKLLWYKIVEDSKSRGQNLKLTRIFCNINNE